MLQLGATSFVIDGITVFRDHADPNQFWYLPAPVRLSERPTDHAPAFTLVVYKPAAVTGGAKGGGFLMFEVDLRMDQDTEQGILAEVRRFAPGRPVLSPVPFDEGEVQCVALNVQGPAGTHGSGAFTAVEEILGAAVPSLFGDNQAIFSLTLSTAGATIMKQAFDQGAAPVGVIYKLRFTALRPALHVTITADLSRVYQELSLGVDAQVYWVRVGIEAAFQKLRQDGVIQIKVDDFVPGPERPQQEQWALDFFRDKLLADWFEPSLSPARLPGQASVSSSSSSGGGVVSHPISGTSPVGTSGSAAPVGARPTGGPLGGPPPLGATGGPPPAGARPAGQTVGPPPAVPTGGPPPVGSPPPAGSPPPGAAGTSPPPPPPPPPPDGVRGGVTPNPSGGNPAGNPATGSKPATSGQAAAGGVDTALVSFKLRYVRQEERKHVELVLDRAEAVQRVYAPQGFFDLLAGTLSGPAHFVDVDLDDPFFREFTVRMQCGVDFAGLGLDGISVSLEYGRATDPGGPKGGTFVFDAGYPGDQTFGVYVNKALDTAYRYRIEYNFRQEAGWTGRDTAYEFSGETEDRTLDLDPSLRLGFLDITVEPADLDPGAIAFTDVRLTYQDPDGWRPEKTLVVRPGGEIQHWRVRSDTRLAKSFTYSFSHTLVDGSVIAAGPQAAAETRVAVVDPFPGRLDIDLVPAWDAASGIRTVFVELVYDDPVSRYHRELRVELAGPQTAATKTHIALRDPTARAFSHRSTFIATSGQVQQTVFVSTTDTLVLVRPT
jgi:hypothetical protein